MSVEENRSRRSEGQSFVQRDPAERQVCIILFRGVDLHRQDADDGWDICRCEDTKRIMGLCEGAGRNVLLVDLTLLSKNERVLFEKQIGYRKTVLSIALSDETSLATCEHLLRAGFAGLVSRAESSENLARAIRVVLNGQLWFPREAVSQVLRGFVAAHAPNRLTSREADILKLIGKGLNNQQIADALFITRETVRWHVKSIHSKTGVGDRRIAKELFRSLHRDESVKPVRAELPDELEQPLKAS